MTEISFLTYLFGKVNLQWPSAGNFRKTRWITLSKLCYSPSTSFAFAFHNLHLQVREEYLNLSYTPSASASGDSPIDQDLCAISNYELQSVKVCQSSLYAEAKLPAFATARVPFGVAFKLTNRTDFMLEFNLSMESSEAFMLSGNKQQHFKIPPGKGSYDLHYVFYPLLAGEAVPLPRPKLSSLRPALPHDDVGATLERLLPASILGKWEWLVHYAIN